MGHTYLREVPSLCWVAPRRSYKGACDSSQGRGGGLFIFPLCRQRRQRLQCQLFHSLTRYGWNWKTEKCKKTNPDLCIVTKVVHAWRSESKVYTMLRQIDWCYTEIIPILTVWFSRVVNKDSSWWLRPSRGSVKLVSTNLTNLVPLEQFHRKPMGMST